MQSDTINLKKIKIILFLAAVVFFIYFFLNYFNTQTKVVFCDVGQGDGAYIRVKNKIDLLIDAGPDKKILNCLGKYMPFWDRKIELAIISHPQKDHFGGFLYLLDRYQIEKMLMTPLDSPSQSFKRLKDKLKAKKISVDFPKAGTKIKILNDKIDFYWPTENFLAENLLFPIAHLDNDRGLDKKAVLGASSLDDNNFSLIFLFEENNFGVLFTGDATPKILNEIAENITFTGSVKDVVILKVPHHGSKNGLTEKFLQWINPALAVISVGKNNSYGHPTKTVLEMLETKKIKIKRTDKEGDIVFKIPNSKDQETNKLQ